MLTVRHIQKTVYSYTKIKVKQWFKCISWKYKTSTYVNCIKNRYLISQFAKFYKRKMSTNGDCEPFRFTDYDCIGFDLDNTICRYKIGAMLKMEYEGIASYLVEEKGYSGKYLLRPIEENVDFMLKGLVLDVNKGNILRIDPNGHILHGCHGTKELSKHEIIEYYGEDQRWELTKEYSNNPLQLWNGPNSLQMRSLLDYFDMPAGLAYARVVDTLDEENGGKKLSNYNIYPHILDALNDMFKRENFGLHKGKYFPNIKEKPENYYHKCSENLLKWFKDLKSRNKILFLITGSNADFASYTAENSMGKDWKSFFDIIIFFAKKPGFFTENRPFIGLDGFVETEPIENKDLVVGGSYTHGNWNGLHDFLKRCINKKNPKIVYIGDNLIQDVYTPSVHTACDAVAICEELQAEGVFGHDKDHDAPHFITSSQWGSYFHHDESKEATIWKNIIKTHSKLCIPSLEYVANFPVDHEFSTHHLFT